MEGQPSPRVRRAHGLPHHRERNVPHLCALLLCILTSVSASASGIERPKYRTVYACEGATLDMACESDHMINLIRANYGRFSITICNEHGNTEWSVNCMSLRSHRVLHDRCSQKQNCSVAASTRVFGDACPGTLKYLEAHFQCLPVNPPSHTARPRPPWVLAAKTTMPSVTADESSPHQDTAYSKIIPFVEPDAQERLKQHLTQKITSSTTTLRPPPWLKTNSTKNATTTTPFTTVTTTSIPPTTTAAVSAANTESESPSSKVHVHNVKYSSGNFDAQANSEQPHHRDIEDNNGARMNPEDSYHQQDDAFGGSVSSTTVSSTTLWVSQETPATGTTDTTSWCAPSSGRGIFWNWTQAGEVAVQSCPGGASGWATRPCDPQGWIHPPDLGECRSVWLTALMSRAEAKDAVLSVVHDLTLVTESRALYGGDITATARLLNSLTTRMAGEVNNFPDEVQRQALITELVMRAMATGSNLLGRQVEAWGDLRPSEHRAAMTELLLGMEETAFLLADNLYKEKILSHQVPNILMRIQVLETRNVGTIVFPTPKDDPWPLSGDDMSVSSTMSNPPVDRGEEDEMSLTTSSSEESFIYRRNPERHLEDVIVLPPEAMLENSENGLVKMVFFTYDGLEGLLQPERSFRYTNAAFKPLNKTIVLNSRVISASLGAGRHIELSKPVLITFKMLRTTNVTNPSCVFWDYPTSTWSPEGCRVANYNFSHTVCQCDHLTNFAVLMDLHSTAISVPHKMALSVITYVGCVVSIVCLLLAIIVFHAFRGLQNDRTTIHKNLCLCLMLGEAIFVGGISQTGNTLVCSLVAGFLHYFFLAAFAWMFLEGFQLYVMLLEVFEAEKSRARWYYCAAYGFPALVVTVSAVIDPYSYGTEEICWLRTDNYFIFSFVGPVLLVLVANSIFLALSLGLMCRHASNSAALKNKEQSKLEALRSWVRGSIILMFLLGLTWTFGLLYLDKASVAMAYVFTVLNSLQGLFIFIFHCVQNDKKYSFKSCGRDSGHGGSEQEESPRTIPPSKLSSLRLNNSAAVAGGNGTPHLMSPFAAAAALEPLPPPPLSAEAASIKFPVASHSRMGHRNQSPWNHTYTEIPDTIPARALEVVSVDPVYEEIERDGRSEIQVSDLSDEDGGRRQNSDISRQSSRSYGDHRPLLPPYPIPERECTTLSNDVRLSRTRPPRDAFHHLAFSQGQLASPLQSVDHTVFSAGHAVPLPHPHPHPHPHPSTMGACHASHHLVNGHIGVPESTYSVQGHPPVVQPLSEPNLRNWEAVQRHRDLQQLQQQLGEMTVAVLNGEQVVCKLKSPLAPIHENASSQTTTGAAAPTASGSSERYLVPQTFNPC